MAIATWGPALKISRRAIMAKTVTMAAIRAEQIRKNRKDFRLVFVNASVFASSVMIGCVDFDRHRGNAANVHGFMLYCCGMF